MTTEPLKDELDRLVEELLKMGRLLEEQVFRAIKSLVDKDVNIAGQVIANEDLIDQMEMDIERKTLGLIALKQPMARDLRLLATILHMISDIERMADHAEDIARIAIDLHDQAYIKPLIDIPRMGVVAREMIEKALQAFIDEDRELAMSLVDMEKQLDSLYQQIFTELLEYMMRDRENIPQSTALLLVAGHLERVGDHATNLGEMVFYMMDGKRVDLNRVARSDYAGE